MLTDEVRAEAVSLRRGGVGPDANARDAIDWQAWLDAGILAPASLQSEELADYLAWLQWLDDGEAACLAMAGARSWGIVTDDIVARKRAAHLPSLATPDLLHNWAQTEKVAAPLLRETLGLIRQRARYGPPRAHPLRQWWLDSE